MHTLNDYAKSNKISYDDLQSIAVTAVETLAQVRERCLAAEAERNVMKKILDEAQQAINERDFKLNQYDGKQIDKNILNTLEETQGLLSDDIKYEEIRRKKMEEMERKSEEYLRNVYNFAPRY